MKNKIQTFDDRIKEIEVNINDIDQEKMRMEKEKEIMEREFVYQDILGFFRYFYSKYPSCDIPDAYYTDQIITFFVKAWISTPFLWEEYSKPIQFDGKLFLLKEIERLETLEDGEIEKILGHGYWKNPSCIKKRAENLEIFAQYFIE